MQYAVREDQLPHAQLNANLFTDLLSPSSSSLEKYSVDGDRLSVSGLSSGAYFAVQFHVAFSKDIMGVGVLAGGKLPPSKLVDLLC